MPVSMIGIGLSGTDSSAPTFCETASPKAMKQLHLICITTGDGLLEDVRSMEGLGVACDQEEGNTLLGAKSCRELDAEFHPTNREERY